MIGESTEFSNWCYVYDGWCIFCITCITMDSSSSFTSLGSPTYQPTKVVNHSPWIKKPPLHKTWNGTLQVTKHHEATYHNQSLTPSSSTSKPPNFFIQVARRKFPGLSISSAKASTNLAIIRWVYMSCCWLKQLEVGQSITCWWDAWKSKHKHAAYIYITQLYVVSCKHSHSQQLELIMFTPVSDCCWQAVKVTSVGKPVSGPTNS